MIRKQFCFLCFVLALACVSVVGQVASPSATPQTSKSGIITGRVVNEKGQPLPNARVSLRALGSRNPGQSIITDQDGRFEVSGLERKTYQIAAWAHCVRASTSKPVRYAIEQRQSWRLCKPRAD